MSEVTNRPDTKQNLQANLEVLVHGKISRVRRYDGNTYTTIITPAADAYSKPQIVEIRSKQRFGETDEITTQKARIGGYEGKAYQVVDKETGERRQLVPVNLYLDLIE